MVSVGRTVVWVTRDGTGATDHSKISTRVAKRGGTEYERSPERLWVQGAEQRQIMAKVEWSRSPI